MPLNTATMLLPKPVDADNAEQALASSIPQAFDIIEAHNHGLGVLGHVLATNAFPSAAVLPAPSISGHAHVTGSAPTVAAQAAMGGGTATITGTDGWHTVVLTPAGGGGLASGIQAIITFNAVFVNPHVMISAHGNAPPGAGAYTVNILAGSYSIAFATVGVAATAYTFYCQVIDLG